MGTKLNPGDYDCYENALPDEPMFILLARDPQAPELVEAWAQRRLRHGEKPAMVKEALDCARNMRTWREANNGKWRRTNALKGGA